MNSSQFLFWEFAALPLQFWEADHATLTANEIAQTAEFFSFGTNDLTQTCLGMSRDGQADQARVATCG